MAATVFELSFNTLIILQNRSKMRFSPYFLTFGRAHQASRAGPPESPGARQAAPRATSAPYGGCRPAATTPMNRFAACRQGVRRQAAFTFAWRPIPPPGAGLRQPQDAV